MSASALVISQSEGITFATINTASLTEGTMIDAMAKELYALVDEYDYKKLVVDFRHVGFLSSRMISTLTTLHKKSHAIDGKLVLCGMKPELKKVFQITKLDKILTFADTESDAVKQFKKLGLW